MATRARSVRERQQADTFERSEQARRAGTIFAYGMLSFWAILSLVPIYFLFIMSFQDLGVSFTVRDIQWFPINPNLENYVTLFQLDAPYWIERRPIWRWAFNSGLVALIPTISNLVFDSAAGYALAKMRFPGRGLIFGMVIATMAIPEFITFIPLYRMMSDFHWMNTYWALLFPGFAGVAGIFLMKQSIQSLPSSLMDAARIDACSEWGIFWKIVLPLSKPVLAIVGITSFMAGWNSYFWPYLVAQSRDMLTLQAGLSSMMGAGATGLPPSSNDLGVVMAGAALAAIPMIVVFFIFQKYIVQGITVGGMKG
ncbi:MAG: carbohydrate ABC transporter permease [Trueperaceae bacterium]